MQAVRAWSWSRVPSGRVPPVHMTRPARRHAARSDTASTHDYQLHTQTQPTTYRHCSHTTLRLNKYTSATKLCVLTYRCLRGLGPDYFSSEFTRVSDLRRRQRLRSASTAALIVLATRHSTLGDRAFPVIGARLWNSLPDDITTATSLMTFRHKLKTFPFRRSYDNVDS